jgi:hypothetical protein
MSRLRQRWMPSELHYTATRAFGLLCRLGSLLFVRWISNDCGTIISRIDSLPSVAPGQRWAPAPYVCRAATSCCGYPVGPRSNACCTLSMPSQHSASTRPTRRPTIGITSAIVRPSMKCRYFFAKPEVRGSGHPQGARPLGARDQLKAAQNCDHSIGGVVTIESDKQKLNSPKLEDTPAEAPR